MCGCQRICSNVFLLNYSFLTNCKFGATTTTSTSCRQSTISQGTCMLCVAVVAAGGRMPATKRRIVLATWSISHGGMPVMCG
jgi:hypothetical protein